MLKKLTNFVRRTAAIRKNRRQRLGYETLETRQLLATYYVDASTGSDSNTGSHAAPFESYLPFVSAYGQDDPNVGRIELQAGDEVVFAAGEYDDTFRLPGSSVDHGFRLRGINGTSDAPIVLRGEPGAVFAGTAPDGGEFTKINLFDTSHVVIEGFEVTGFGTGIQISESSDILVRENYIHDIDGDSRAIIAGLAISQSSNVEATENLIHDNYDRSTPAFNSYNVEFDENTGYVEFHNNYVFNTGDNVRTGTGPGVKHDGEGLLEIHHNVIRNAANAGIALDTRLAYVHNNLVIDSEALWLVPNESIVANEELHDINISNNTIVDQTAGDRVGGGLNFAARVQESEGSIRFDNNIVVDLDQQGQSQGILNIAPYGSNEEYRFWVESGRIQADGNVYFNPNHDARFDVFSADSRGDLGELYSFSQWQELGFDRNGALADPELDNTFASLNPEASQAGWYSGETRRLTVLASDNNIIEEGGSTTITVTRSGDDLNLAARQTVNLSASVADAIDLPDSITFEPGQRSITIEVTNRLLGDDSSPAAVRISATAAGFENNVSSWLRLLEGSEQSADPVNNGENNSDTPAVPRPEPPTGTESEVPQPESPEQMTPEVIATTSSYENGILTLPSTTDDTIAIEFDFTQRLAQFNNELGLAVVQADGSIDGVSPEDADYTRRALESGTTLFAKGAGAGDTTTAQVPGGSRVIFYIIQNASKSEVLAANPENQLNAGPLVFFSNVDANPDQFDHVNVRSEETNQFQFGWEDLVNGGDQSYTDAVIDLRIDPQGVSDKPNDEAEPSQPPVETPVAPSVPLHNELQPGDVDQDGEVTLRDAVFVFWTIQNRETESDRLFLADVNGDGFVNFDDIIGVISIWAKQSG